MQLRRKRRYERDKLSVSVRKRQLEVITRWRFMLDSNSEPRTILLPYSHSLNKIVIDIIMTAVIKVLWESV